MTIKAEGTSMSWRRKLTRATLWPLTLGWGILLGSKLFDLRVLVGAWSASPPESLSLLPYGDRYPVDTGEYFFPISGPLLIFSILAVVAGWKTPLKYRGWLILQAVMILLVYVLTIFWFWPQNFVLWDIARSAPNAIQDRSEVIKLVRQWVAFDWLRVATMAVGFVSVVRSISVPFPDWPTTRTGEGKA